MISNEEFIQEFIEEATMHIELVESGLLEMEEGKEDSQNINNIFRSIHSVKGTAGFFGLVKIVDLAHAMETLLGEIRSGKIKVNSKMVDILLNSNDCLKEMVENIYESENKEISDYVTKLMAMVEGREIQETEEKREKISEKIIKDSKENMLNEAIKHGQHLYKVKLGLKRDLEQKNISPVQFFKRIQSVGQIIDSYTDISDIEDLEDVLDADIYFSFLFTTVLEKKLLPLALEIEIENIEELDINHKIMSLKEEIENGFSTEEHEVIGEQSFGDEKVKNSIKKEPQTVKQEIKNVVETKTANVEDSIRVHVSLLNNLLNLSGEMVLGRNQLLRFLENYRKEIPGIEPILQNIDRITTELQEKIMQTRMQPVGNVFNKMPRVIRDLSKKLGKEVDLKIEGSEVELDKSIIESLSDPLTHLIRNSVDHGIEKPEKREAKGKNKIGKVVLKAYHEGGHVHIDIIDDGAGVDIQIIKEKAFEKGIVTTEELRNMSDQEVLQLLFRPGFSTAAQITDVSGRGVGMDVVKTNIEKLGGMIEIYTKKGEGANFRLILPLTLAIVPSLIVEVNNQRFALPQVNLQEMVRIKKGDNSRKIEYVNKSEVLRLRGKLLPIVHLKKILNIQEKDQKETDKKAKDITRVLVLKIGARRFGLVVDKIHDEEEILVKPLPSFLKDCQAYSGVTIMGDGKTAMILDPDGIINKASLKFGEEMEKNNQKDLMEKSEKMREMQNILLFKCSGHESFAIDLSLVARVEKIESTVVETIGDKEYIQYRGESLRVIRPENYLPVSKANTVKEEMYVIIPKLIAQPVGFLIERLEDTMTVNIKLNKEDIKSKGILGSTILNKKIVLLINMYEILEMATPEYYEDGKLKNSGERIRILLAEDTPFFARMEKNYLEWAGYEVVLAENGQMALEQLYLEKIDIIVTDIEMPIMNGWEFLKKVRANSKYNHIPIIALTSLTGESQREKGLQAGFDFYEFKLDKIKILKTLEQALKKGMVQNG